MDWERQRKTLSSHETGLNSGYLGNWPLASIPANSSGRFLPGGLNTRENWQSSDRFLFPFHIIKPIPEDANDADNESDSSLDGMLPASVKTTARDSTPTTKS